jgi:hypothetical membrane protein
MATSSEVLVGRRLSSGAWSRTTDLAIGGTLLSIAGGVILIGIISAEALYPGSYATGANEISDLGGTRPPEGLVLQPSAAIFDLSMIAIGLLMAAGALIVHRAFGRPTVSLPIGVLGVAALGVGVFPGNTGAPHALCAMVTFVAGGVAALTSARVVTGPFRVLTSLLGVITLGVLVSYLILGDSHPMTPLGVGGIERWIVYPVVIWTIAFGGYLAGLGGLAAGPGAEAGRPQPTDRAAR